ncbi:MAG: ferredoxin [Lentisphaerae bacterium]|nr:ferredoxin [Lentisphaerota bacterium]
MKATIDSDACVGCGLCPDTCSAVFEMDGDLARVTVEDVPIGEEDACRDAAQNCPVDAIMIDE